MNRRRRRRAPPRRPSGRKSARSRASKIASLRSRMRPQRAEGSAGRADALVDRVRRAAGDRSRSGARLSREPARRPLRRRSIAPPWRRSSPHRTSPFGSTISSANMMRSGPSFAAAARRTAGGPIFQREIGSIVELHSADSAGGKPRSALRARRCSGSSRVMSTRRSPKRCAFRARRAPATGSARRAATSSPTARSTRSSPPR